MGVTSASTTTTTTVAALDEPLRAALDGPQRPLAVRHGAAVRYHPDVAPFLAPPRDAAEWADAAALTAPDGVVVIRAPGQLELPHGWRVERNLPGVQMVLDDATAIPGVDEADLVTLGPSDVDTMLALVGRTRPGPFARRTIELGTYLGVPDDLAGLVAMAGERMHPRGATEISAVCTDPAYRRQGLATGLVRAVADLVRERGDVPFLHTSAANTRAIRLYLAMGFDLRTEVQFVALRAV